LASTGSNTAVCFGSAQSFQFSQDLAAFLLGLPAGQFDLNSHTAKSR